MKTDEFEREILAPFLVVVIETSVGIDRSIEILRKKLKR